MKVTLLLLSLSLYTTLSFGLGNSSGGRSATFLGRSTSYKSDSQKPVYNGLGYANGDYHMKQATVAKPAEATSRRGIGLSAWGIIAVLAGGVFLCTGAYYAVLFYPILCKKERKYDIMELTSV